MADLLIVGSFAFDTINTQTARRENVLGGTGSHASYGASFYTKVFASGRVGGADWKDEDSKMLQAHNINIENLQIVPGEKTTSWEAVYEADMNNRSTLSFCPNCCVEFHPNLTEAARKCPYIFLANNSPESQMEVIESAIAPKLIVADTMDYYINGSRAELDKVLKKVDGLILNDSEVQLGGEDRPFRVCGRDSCDGAGFRHHQEGRARQPFPEQRRESVRFPGVPVPESHRADRRGRLLCRRVHGLPRLPGKLRL